MAWRFRKSLKEQVWTLLCWTKDGETVSSRGNSMRLGRVPQDKEGDDDGYGGSEMARQPGVTECFQVGGRQIRFLS